MNKLYFSFLIFALALNINGQQLKFDQLWSDPSVVRHINENTEKHRKGNAVIEIKDKDGNPVSNALIEVHQKTHEFLFGCNLFVLGQLETPELNEKYENAFSGLFNFATLPFYWRGLEPNEGHPRFAEDSEPIWRRPPPDKLLKWCKENGITAKGHALIYAKTKFMPDWTAKNDPELFLKQAKKHMTEIAERYRDDIVIWDVLNEEIHRIRHLDQWHKVPDPMDYLAWSFKVAGSLFPGNVKLLNNEGFKQVHPGFKQVQNYEGEYESSFKYLLNKGIRVDGMGIHYHIYEGMREEMLEGKILTPEHFFEVYEQLGQLNLPMYVTEITIAGSGDNGSVKQADIVENLYRLWFSTPNMAGLTWWNLADGTAYGNENNALGGLLDKEMNPKPAYNVLDKLINQEWQTNITIESDSKGEANFRGFYGKYQIIVKYMDKEFEQEINLKKDSNNIYTIKL
jgi:endo-1,4-beta-xylanase